MAEKKLYQIIQMEAVKREAAEIKLQEQITGMDADLRGHILESDGKYENLRETIAAIQLQLLDSTSPIPCADFPRFDGSNPRAWILRCNSYFKVIPNIPETLKVSLAAMHFDGKALNWFHSLGPRQWESSWVQFLEIISARFVDLREYKIITEFNKLKQTGGYADYVEKFEELRACMLLRNQNKYSEEYFVASFMSGLSEDLQAFINMFEPSTLQQTIELGRMLLLKYDAIAKRSETPVKPFSSQTSTFRKPHQGSKLGNLCINGPKPPRKALTAAEMSARMDKGLCYNCDEPFAD